MVRMAGSKRRSEPLTAVTIKKVKRNTEEVAKKMVAPLSNVTITKVKKDYEIDEEDEVVEMDEEEEVVEMEEETMQEEEVTDADLEEVKEEDVDEVKYDDDSDSEELVVDEDVQDDEESKADIEYLMNEEEETDNNGDVEVIEEEPIVKEGFLRREILGKVEFYSPECRRIEGHPKLLELLLDQGHGFQVTGPVARAVNWGRLGVARRKKLKARMNQLMLKEQGGGGAEEAK